MIGDYPRATGRSTKRCLRYILEGLLSPGRFIEVVDHHDTYAAHQQLLQLCKSVVETLPGAREFEWSSKGFRFSPKP